MRKGKLVLLAMAFALVAVVPVSAPAADKAGVGLDWGIGPNLVAGNFKMQFDNAFALSWKVSEAFTVAVFNSAAPWRGEYSYTSEAANDGTDATEHKYLISRSGDLAISGIRILHAVPGLDFISAGIELGTVAISDNAATCKLDGVVSTAATTLAAFTDTTQIMPTSAALIGIAGKVSIFKAESKTVTTDINVTGAFRIISIPETSIWGTQKAYLAEPKAIDGVTSYNNLNVLLGIGLWF